jgi:hypothetical protein
MLNLAIRPKLAGDIRSLKTKSECVGVIPSPVVMSSQDRWLSFVKPTKYSRAPQMKDRPLRRRDTLIGSFAQEIMRNPDAVAINFRQEMRGEQFNNRIKRFINLHVSDSHECAHPCSATGNDK